MKRDALPAIAAAPTADAAWAALRDAACMPYRDAGRWASHWARGKLTGDPVFRSLLERGHLSAGTRALDIGCGQGLVASLMQACADAGARGAWPASWPAPPAAATYTGIELMASDVARAEAALARLPLAPRFARADMLEAHFPPCDLVVILDVLHYVDHAAQQQVLGRVRDALAAGAGAGGRLLLRVGDAASPRGFAVSQWVDRIVTAARGHRQPPTWGRTLADWTALLRERGFARVRAEPMSQGTPFANVLLVADLADGTGGAR